MTNLAIPGLGTFADVAAYMQSVGDAARTAARYVARQLVLLGGQPAWRMGFTTDNGNVILDLHGLSLTNPAEMEAKIRNIVGVVTVGLFAHRGEDVILLGTDAGVRVLKPRG